MAPTAQRQLAKLGAALLLAVAFVVSLTGFRRPPGWVGVTHQLSFATDVPRPAFEEAGVDEQGWPIDDSVVDRDEILQQASAVRLHIAKQITPRWHREPPSTRGSFIRESWCQPMAGSDGCLSRSDDENHRLAPEMYQLDLVRDDAPSRQLVGYVLTARSTSGLNGDVDHQLKLARGGGRVIRPGLFVEHTRPNAPEGTIHFGTSYELRVGPLHCVMYVPGYRPQTAGADQATIEELLRLVESPTSLRDTVSTRLNTLLERAETALTSGEMQDDICSFESGAQENSEALRQEIHQIIERRLDVISENSASIHEWLSTTIPVENIDGNLH